MLAWRACSYVAQKWKFTCDSHDNNVFYEDWFGYYCCGGPPAD